MQSDKPFKEIGERLASLRLAVSGESQRTFAAQNGFNANQYNNWEAGVRRIPVDAAERLCDRYGLTLDFVYRGRVEGLSEYLRKAV